MVVSLPLSPPAIPMEASQNVKRDARTSVTADNATEDLDVFATSMSGVDVTTDPGAARASSVPRPPIF